MTEAGPVCVAGALVRVGSELPLPRDATTDDDGRYVLAGLPDSRVHIDDLWRRAVPLAAGLLRLDPVDEAVIHLGHIARHELMVPVINYVDAARLLDRVDRAAIADRAAAFRLGRGVRAALAMTDAITRGAAPAATLDARVLPSVQEVFAYGRVWRPLQCLRKALLVDGPVELVGLAAVGVYDGLAHRLRP